MNVLIDECLPRYLKKGLVGHQAQTVQDVSWDGVKNGELLALPEVQFEVFVTADQNLRYQQNLTQRKIAIIELPTNTLSVVKKLVPQILEALARIQSGDYIQIKILN